MKVVPKCTRPGGQPNNGTRKGKRELHLECKMGCDVLRMGNETTHLAVASIGLLTGERFPVEVYATLRTGSGSAIGTGPGLGSRQRQLLGYRNDQR